MSVIAQDIVVCAHCSTPFQPRAEEEYCCHGCAYVAGLLADNGLEDFYHFKGDAVLPPVGSRVFQNEEYDSLQKKIKLVEESGSKSIIQSTFTIQGISCMGCVWLIEAVFNQQDGAIDIRVNTTESQIRLSWQKEQCDLIAFAKRLQALGYKIGPVSEQGEASVKHSSSLAKKVCISGFFLLNVMLYTLPGYLGMESDYFLTPLFGLLAILFTSLSLVTGGGYFFKRAYTALLMRRLHIDLPISIGIAAAYVGSIIGWFSGQEGLLYFDFVASFIFLMLLGRWLQEQAIERSRAQLSKQQYKPDSITLIGGSKDGKEINAEEIKESTSYAIGPGKVIPVSSRLSSEYATLSLEWINGEPEPVVWRQSKVVPAGAINLGVEGITLTAEESWEDGLLARLMRSPQGEFRSTRVEKFLGAYLAIVMCTSAAGGIIWLTLGLPWTAIQVFISLLVVSCPCAIGVALPMANELAASQLRKEGLFIKAADIWEKLRQVRYVIFDKTGTLSLENPRLQNPGSLKALSTEQVEALLKLVSNNLHPSARAIREVLLANFSSLSTSAYAGRFVIKEAIGRGVKFCDQNKEWSLGHTLWPESGEDGPKDAQVVFRCDKK